MLRIGRTACQFAVAEQQLAGRRQESSMHSGVRQCSVYFSSAHVSHFRGARSTAGIGVAGTGAGGGCSSSLPAVL